MHSYSNSRSGWTGLMTTRSASLIMFYVQRKGQVVPICSKHATTQKGYHPLPLAKMLEIKGEIYNWICKNVNLSGSVCSWRWSISTVEVTHTAFDWSPLWALGCGIQMLHQHWYELVKRLAHGKIWATSCFIDTVENVIKLSRHLLKTSSTSVCGIPENMIKFRTYKHIT